MKFSAACFTFLALVPSIAQSETMLGFLPPAEQPSGWSALPRSRPFGILPSDPRDLHLGLAKNNKQELEANVGGYRSVAGWRGEISGEDTVFHGGIEGAAYFQLRQDGSKYPLASSDGLLGVYGEAARGPVAYQLRFTHISAHVADGLFATRTPFVYTREFFALRVARDWGWIRPYAGYQFLTHTAPELPRHSLQLGAYSILSSHWGPAHPYFGADLRLRNPREANTFELSTGAAFLSSTGMPPILLTASYLKGHDLRGQFFEERTEKWLFGLDLAL